MTAIDHNAEQHRFQTEVDGHLAYVEYEPMQGGISITHTIVPSEIGGRGIAAALVEASLKHAREQGWKVVPACSYADVWMRRHPEYASLRA
jgi:uncharacterized protein